MYNINKRGPSIDPCSTPPNKENSEDLLPPLSQPNKRLSTVVQSCQNHIYFSVILWFTVSKAALLSSIAIRASLLSYTAWSCLREYMHWTRKLCLLMWNNIFSNHNVWNMYLLFALLTDPSKWRNAVSHL